MSRDLRLLAETYEKAGAHSRLLRVAAPPFWNRIGVAKCPELVETTVDALRMVGVNVEKGSGYRHDRGGGAVEDVESGVDIVDGV